MTFLTVRFIPCNFFSRLATRNIKITSNIVCNRNKSTDKTSSEVVKAETSPSTEQKQQKIEPGLEEFFDDRENWGKDRVVTGRPWRLDELRIKSNSDLHKLWYVLLKERNMLMTMEEYCSKHFQPFPCPERYYKVEESMQNVERVIGERNRSFIELETGETGERPSRVYTTILGFRDKKYLTEHDRPGEVKEKVYEQPYFTDDQRMFQKLYYEKMWERQRDLEDDRKREDKKHKRWHKY